MLEGNRKLLFFTLIAGVAAWKLTDGNLMSVLVTLATVFGGANAIEHHSKK